MARVYTEAELERIASIMYDIAAVRSCTIYDMRGAPICTMWHNLSPSEKSTSIQGLKQRIERETLPGYFERKKKQVPAATAIYEDTIKELKRAGLM